MHICWNQAHLHGWSSWWGNFGGVTLVGKDRVIDYLDQCVTPGRIQRPHDKPFLHTEHSLLIAAMHTNILSKLTSRLPALALQAIGCLALLCNIGCGDPTTSQATNILGTDQSVFKDADIETLIVKRKDDLANIAAQSELDLSLVTQQHFVVAVFEGKKLRDYFSQRDLQIDTALLEPKPAAISMQQLKHVVLAVDDSILAGLGGGQAENKGWFAQVDFSQSVDQTQWSSWLLGPTASKSTVGGVDVWLTGDKSICIYWPSGNRAIVSPKDEIEKIQTRTKNSASSIPSELAREVFQNRNQQLLFVSLRASPLRETVNQMAQMAATFGAVDERMQMTIDAASSLENVNFHADLAGEPLGQMTVNFLDATAAKSIQSLINQGIDQLASQDFQNSPENGRAQPGDPSNPAAEISKELRQLLIEISSDFSQGGVTSIQDGSEVQVNFARPSRFDELIDQSITGWTKSRGQLYRMRQFGEISAAMQKFQRKYGRLPAASASPLVYMPIVKSAQPTPSDSTSAPAIGEKNDETDTASNPEFSWRVALLPELGFQELYDQFDFSQPWDSENNLKTASKMPSLFDSSFLPATGEQLLLEGPDDSQPESDFQLLTGKMGAMGEANITSADQAVDGADRTLYLAQTPKLKTIWTKPGGWDVDQKQDLLNWRQSDDRPLMITMLSGRVLMVPNDISIDSILAWVTVDGGERTNRSDINKMTIFPPVETE